MDGDAAEENLNLHVLLGWIATRDRSGCKRRFLTGSGICFCVVHSSNVDRSVQGRCVELRIGMQNMQCFKRDV